MHALSTASLLLLTLSLTSASLTPARRHGAIPIARSLADLPEFSAESSLEDRDLPPIAPHVALLDRQLNEAGFTIENILKRGIGAQDVINQARDFKFVPEEEKTLKKRQTTAPAPAPVTPAPAPATVTKAAVLGQAGCKVAKRFALSFDDGVYDASLQLAQRIKKTNNSTASFFLNGYNWRCTYNLADKLVAMHKLGHFLGSHGWSHAHSNAQTYEQMHLQLKLVEDMFDKILGYKPIYFRPPYGEYNDLVLQVVAERGYRGIVLWSDDSGDTFYPPIGADAIVARYQTLIDAFPKSPSVLNHDVQGVTTNEVMPRVLPLIRAKGFKMVSIPECLATGSDPSKWMRKTTGKYGKRDATWTCDGTPVPGAS